MLICQWGNVAQFGQNNRQCRINTAEAIIYKIAVAVQRMIAVPASLQKANDADRTFSKWICWILDSKCSLSSCLAKQLNLVFIYSLFRGTYLSHGDDKTYDLLKCVLCIFICFKCIILQKILLIKLQRSQCFISYFSFVIGVFLHLFICEIILFIYLFLL